MAGFFKKLKEGLIRETPTFQKAYKVIFKRKKIDVSSIEALEESLYEADFGVETTEEIVNKVQKAYKKDKNIRKNEISDIAIDVMKGVLEGADQKIEIGTNKPEVICLIGVNGSGKTTTCAKLAQMFKSQGLDVLMGACDTFRAAANEQLKSWSDRLDIDLIASSHGSDAAAVAFDSMVAAQKRNKDVLLLDTAGRLHTKSNLMDELTKIKRVLKKIDDTTPHHSWLVIDGSLGTNSIEQARVFHEKFGLTGLIITKLDGTSRGGALVGIYRELKLPIYFIGLGEEPDDLKPFSLDLYLNAVFEETEKETV